MCVERVAQGTQDTALWGSYIQGDGVGGELALFHHLWSAGEEVLNPVTDGTFPLHGMARYGSLLGGFPLGTAPGTWYFFSTTSAGVPSNPHHYQNVTCKLC